MKLCSAILLVLASASAAFALPNPAALNCEKQEGNYMIRQDQNGNQFGICQWRDALETGYMLISECEEWALLNKSCNRGECAYWEVTVSADGELNSFCAGAAEPIMLIPPPVA